MGYIIHLSGQAPLLGAYPNASAAYSLRDLNGSKGSVVRVRRAGDNAEADFSALEITDGTLEGWVTTGGGTTNGLVATWYDQSGNGNHAVQTTAVNQPLLVTSGSLKTYTDQDGSSKPALEFDGSNDCLDCQDIVVGISTSDATVSWVTADVTDQKYAISEADAIVPNYSSNIILGGASASTLTELAWVNSSTLSSVLSPADRIAFFAKHGASDATVYVNNVVGDTATVTINTEEGTTIIGARADQSSSYFAGLMSEIVVWRRDLRTSISEISSEQNKYWRIY